jgi:ParB/RepB/Spo0J family partition protein
VVHAGPGSDRTPGGGSDKCPTPGAGAKEPELQILPLSRIDATNRRYAWRRRPLTGNRVADLVESIRVEGLLHPLTVAEEDGAFVVVCGFRRHAALTILAREDARFAEVPCHVFRGETPAKLLRKSHDENGCRRRVDPIEAAVKVEELVAAGETTYERAAADLGIDVRTLHRYRSLASLPPAVLDAYFADEIRAVHAERLLPLPEPLALLLLAEVRERRLTAKELDRRVFEEIRGGRKVTASLTNLPAGARASFAAGRVEVAVSVAGDGETLEELLARLDEVRDHVAGEIAGVTGRTGRRSAPQGGER